MNIFSIQLHEETIAELNSVLEQFDDSCNEWGVINSAINGEQMTASNWMFVQDIIRQEVERDLLVLEDGMCFDHERSEYIRLINIYKRDYRKIDTSVAERSTFFVASRKW